MLISKKFNPVNLKQQKLHGYLQYVDKLILMLRSIFMKTKSMERNQNQKAMTKSV